MRDLALKRADSLLVEGARVMSVGGGPLEIPWFSGANLGRHLEALARADLQR